MAKKKVITGRDLMATEKYITVNGERMKLVYSNRTYMMMERVWREVYDEKKNFQQILQDVGESMLGAVMIMFYCALRVGGHYTEMEFDDFCDAFDLSALATISDAAFDAALESLPENADDEIRKNG